TQYSHTLTVQLYTIGELVDTDVGRTAILRRARFENKRTSLSKEDADLTDNAQLNKAIVREFLTKTFSDRDFTALERWLSPDYIQHNPFIPATRAGLRALVEKYPEGRHYEPGMIIIAEGDLVMAHGRYSGGGGKTLIAADIFRFEGDLIVEHGYVLQAEVQAEKTVAGTARF